MNIIVLLSRISRRFLWLRMLAPACLAVLLMVWQPAAFAGVSVIVSADSDLPAMSEKEVRYIFLNKRIKLSDGQPAKYVYQDDMGDVYERFSEVVLKKPIGQLINYWAKLIFAGKALPPNVYTTDNEVKAFVKLTPGGIGYINSDAVDDSVKVLFSID